jgi:phage terminase small subunit
VAEYLKDLNATQAAIRAGYSAKTAKQQGQRLLTNVDVQTALAGQMTARSERVKIDADWMLQRLGEDIEADMADLYDEHDNLKPIHQWPPVWRKGLVAGVETVEEKDEDGKVIGLVRKVKLADRSKLKEMTGRHVGVQAFKDRVEHDVTEDLAAAIAAGNARVGK